MRMHARLAQLKRITGVTIAHEIRLGYTQATMSDWALLKFAPALAFSASLQINAGQLALPYYFRRACQSVSWHSVSSSASP
jgi:hypothetical protein